MIFRMLVGAMVHGMSRHGELWSRVVSDVQPARAKKEPTRNCRNHAEGNPQHHANTEREDSNMLT